MAEDAEEEQKAARTLVGACVKLAPQLWYNHKVAAATTFWRSKDERVTKRDIVGEHRDPEKALKLEDYMSVSIMSIRFYIVAKLPLHYLELSIAFSGCTRLG